LANGRPSEILGFLDKLKQRDFRYELSMGISTTLGQKMKNFLLTLWYLPLRMWYNYKDWRYEQNCIKHLGMKPQKMYVSKEAYDALVERLNAPPDPEAVKRMSEILNKKSPWDDNND
jgi:hypothetical protein